jgi:general stress protein YciG
MKSGVGSSKERMMSNTSNRGFASMDQDKQREIASKGGQASGGNFANDRERAAEAGKKGGQASSGNFANNPRRAAEAGRKGGGASHGGRKKVNPAQSSD